MSLMRRWVLHNIWNWSFSGYSLRNAFCCCTGVLLFFKQIMVFGSEEKVLCTVLYSLICMCLRVHIPVIKHQGQSKFWREMFVSDYSFTSQSFTEKTQGRNLKPQTEAEAIEWFHLLSCSNTYPSGFLFLIILLIYISHVPPSLSPFQFLHPNYISPLSLRRCFLYSSNTPSIPLPLVSSLYSIRHILSNWG